MNHTKENTKRTFQVEFNETALESQVSKNFQVDSDNLKKLQRQDWSTEGNLGPGDTKL
jgi:hypothetical protein